MAFRHDVGDTHHFEHSAHWTASNDAGTLGRRNHHHVCSPIGTKESHRATVRGLGLRKLNSVSELQDTPAVRGMINKISYLVKVL